MCGIAGFFDPRPAGAGQSGEIALKRMLGTLVHRGPDSEGWWEEAARGIALGHRRLAILDLTATGAQPMASASGRYVLSFNGEIYNFAHLRDELIVRGHAFRGTSDTEVLLAAITEWGVEAAVRQCTGMFALALYDREERGLHLVRDRMGEKPLYYGWSGGVFLFGSELKALRAHPAWQGTIDRQALGAYFRHSFVPGPATIHENLYKLPPGGWLSLSLDQLTPGALPPPAHYWKMSEIVRAAQTDLFRGSDAEALAELDRRLSAAVGQQMVADVPLGAFLSGGVDSSVIVALMQRQSSRPVKTFTIGFEEGEYNEAVFARGVAQHLGTEHTELYVTARDALDVIPKLPQLYDEPFADSSQIPTYLVSKLARRHVTVSLSGDGGDELFAGYQRYFDALGLWRTLERVPALLRGSAARVIRAGKATTWERAFGWLTPRVAGESWRGRTGDRLLKIAQLLEEADPTSLYLRFICRELAAAQGVVGWQEMELPVARAARDDLGTSDLLTRMTYLDMISYLPDCILTKVDRAAMAVSLEGRIPMLDHQVVEFACRLPGRLKFRDGQSKWLLRQLLYKYLPRALVDRPKMGFGVPIDQWLRGPLRDWAEDLLSETRLRREGFLDPRPIRRKWEEHLQGTRRWHYYLWDVLMFQAWLEANR